MIPKRSDESAFTLRCRKWKMGMGRHLLRYQFCCREKRSSILGRWQTFYFWVITVSDKEAVWTVHFTPAIITLSSECTMQCSALRYMCPDVWVWWELFFFLCPWFSICFQSVSVKKSQGVLWLFLVLFCYRGGKQPAICMVISQFDRYLRNKENSGMKKLCEFNKWSQIEILSLMFK